VGLGAKLVLHAVQVREGVFDLEALHTLHLERSMGRIQLRIQLLGTGWVEGAFGAKMRPTIM
jgi:hypothetical protein